MSLQAVIFDFDGVIADSERVHHRAFLEVLKPAGMHFDFEFYRKTFIGLDDRDTIRRAYHDKGIELGDAELWELVQRKARFFEAFASQIDLCEGIEEILRAAAARVPIAICSGALRQDIEAVLARVAGGELRGLFRTIVSADELSHSKPDPASYRLAVERLGVNPAFCVAIEDTPAGVDSAQGAGLKVVAITHTCGDERLFKAELRIASFRDLAFEDFERLVR
jgi:beta-phosphoglucomutase